MIEYDEPVFRPPSEANSFILQATIGCSWNRCAFCEMYTGKNFRAKSRKEITSEIKQFAPYADTLRKVFLADGNAMVLSSARIMEILSELNNTFPKIRRISAYALPSDILAKSDEELRGMADAGLNLLYVGIESGDDELLRLINKGETFRSTVKGLNKAQKAGMQLSVMILNGLGGKRYSRNHAINSAKVINEIQPHFASTLVLSFPLGVDQYRKRFKGIYEPVSPMGLIEELGIFIENTDLKETIFRSDHASNYLVLKGILARDKGRFLEKIGNILCNPEEAKLRPEWMRGL